MNDLVKTAATELPEVSQLITLKPEKYVAEVFSPFKKQLVKAKKEAQGVTYDIQTTAGMDTAKRLRASFRTIRTSAENTRKERKAPIIEIGKLLDTKYKELAAEIEPLENAYDADIKAEEERKEKEKEAKLAAERAVIEAIENRIQNIKDAPVRHLNANSEVFGAAIDEYSTLQLDPSDYNRDGYLEIALNAVNATILELQSMHKSAIEREEQARKAEEDRKELIRLKAESDLRIKRDLEEKARLANEQRARDEEAKRVQDEQARKIADLQAQLAAATKPAEPEPAPVQSAAGQEVKVEIITDDSGTDGIATTKAGLPLDARAATAPAPMRPSDMAIISTVAGSYGVEQKVVVKWLIDMDLDGLARQFDLV